MSCLPSLELTWLYEVMEISHYAILQGVLDTPNLTRQEALFTVGWQLAMAVNVQEVENVYKYS